MGGSVPNFGLRLAKSGLHAAAARAIGWNEATVRRKAVRRQFNEQRAYESAMTTLCAKVPAAELDRLLAEGAAMSEDEMYALAVQ